VTPFFKLALLILSHGAAVIIGFMLAAVLGSHKMASIEEEYIRRIDAILKEQKKGGLDGTKTETEE